MLCNDERISLLFDRMRPSPTRPVLGTASGSLAGGLAMSMRNGTIVLLSVVLYAIGLYGFWKLMTDARMHWALAAFPCALLVLFCVPYLIRSTKPVTQPEVFDEDRTE
jgi:hypothetical protein